MHKPTLNRQIRKDAESPIQRSLGPLAYCKVPQIPAHPYQYCFRSISAQPAPKMSAIIRNLPSYRLGTHGDADRFAVADWPAPERERHLDKGQSLQVRAKQHTLDMANTLLRCRE